MPQTAGKPAKKSSISKRHFTVVIGSKEHGLYCSSSPSSAARKAVSKLCGKEKGKKVEFCLREITQGSKKKTYGPYLGHIEKLAKPIELKGRLVERMPVARLKPKSSVKKGGMMNAINIILGNCGRSRRIGFWKNGCITLINGQNKVVFYYNEDTLDLEVRYFKNSNNNVYTDKLTYKLDDFNIFNFNTIIVKLINYPNFMFEIKDLEGLVNRIVSFITEHIGELPHLSNIKLFLNKLKINEEERLKYIKMKNDAQKFPRLAEGL